MYMLLSYDCFKNSVLEFVSMFDLKTKIITTQVVDYENESIVTIHEEKIQINFSLN